MDDNLDNDDIAMLREQVRIANMDININVNESNNIHQLIDRDITNLNNDLRLNLKCQVLYGTNYAELVDDFNLPPCNYYSEETIKDFLNSTNIHYLSAYSINVQSILSKFNEITLFLDSMNDGKSKVDILSLQEIWHSFDLTFNGYQYFKNNRSTGQGGGVGFLIRKGISVVQINDSMYFKDRLYECLTLKITVNNQNFILLNVYHPPNTPGMTRSAATSEFILRFEAHIESLDSHNSPVLIFSDFNINFFKLNQPNSEALDLFNILIANAYIPTINKATRITDNSYSLIDNITCKDIIGSIDLCGIIPSNISDHYMLVNLIKLNANPKNKVKPPPIYKRSFCNENLEKFRTALAVTDWRHVMAEKEDVDRAYSIFIDKFLTILDQNIPKRLIKFNDRTTPINQHMTKDLMLSRLKKRQLYLARRNSPQDAENYRIFRNNFNKANRKAKKLHYRERIEDSRGNSKKLWDVLKDTMGTSKKDTRIEYIEVNNKKIFDDVEIANNFNEYLANIGHNLTPLLPKIHSKNFQDYLPPPAEDTFFIRPVTERSLLEILGKMKHKKSSDDNDISLFLVNFVRITIVRPLLHIINLSFKSGKMPDKQKITRTILIHKSGPFYLLDNYRGVSLINSFSKIQEKCLYIQLMDFLNQKQYFNKLQYGFRPKRSTYHAILHLINKITQCLASGRLAMVVLLDVRKCFDMLDRNLLLKKLENLGIRGHSLDWFRSYFSNRRQRVFYKGINSSNLKDIDWGVLQGSILGVLLFLIYINDIDACSDILLSYLFADDNCAYLESDTLTNLINLANTELPKLLDWYNSNKLLLHPGKTKVLIFGLARNDRFLTDTDLGLLNEFPVYFDMNDEGQNLPEKITKLTLTPNDKEKFCRHLGVLIDNKLSFKYHFENLRNRISKIIFSMKMMKNLLHKRHLLLIYNSYLKSILEYCAPIFSGVPETYLRPITILQKKAIRIICNVSNRTHTRDLFIELKLLTYKKLLLYNSARFMYMYKRNAVPATFENTWQLNREVRDRDLRNNEDYYIPFTGKNYLKALPLYKFPTIWNNLPTHIKNIDDKNEFNRKLFSYLLNLN